MEVRNNRFSEKIKHYNVSKPLLYFWKRYVRTIYVRLNLIETDFPPEIWIENTNCCNAGCIICPREKHIRKTGFMDILLYEKLIKEIAAWQEKVNRVHLHNFGEPLLDKKLSLRIRIARDLGIKHTYFVTNASLLTKEKSRQIIEAGLDEFKISFYGTDFETYNTIMKGLNFDNTLKNIKDFFDIRKEMGRIEPRVIIQYIPMEYNDFRTDEFINMMTPLIDKNIGDSLNIFSLHNYVDGRSYMKADEVTRICPFPWNTMVILYDGKVILCSPDYNGINAVGDATKCTIKEIWNGEIYKKVREDFKRLHYDAYPLCIKCTVTG